MRLQNHLTKFISKTIPFRLESSLSANDYWALLFIGCISLFEHKLLVLAILYIGFKTNKKPVISEAKAIPDELESIVLFIHSNRLQSLTEAIESNPDILYCEYRKRSLLSWCKFYNNPKAQMVVAQMTQKYPREKQLAA